MDRLVAIFLLSVLSCMMIYAWKGEHDKVIEQEATIAWLKDERDKLSLTVFNTQVWGRLAELANGGQETKQQKTKPASRKRDLMVEMCVGTSSWKEPVIQYPCWAKDSKIARPPIQPQKP